MKKGIAIIVLIVLILLGAKVVLWSSKFFNDTGLTPGIVFRLMTDHGTPLKSRDGQTNILVMGVGGGEHEGNDLTDTMMVLSIDNSKNSTALISIPRDIWSDTLKDRVNSAYHYGEEKQAGGGLVLAKVITEDIVGIPIHYGIVIDFSGFERVIDEVGGIDVDVPTAFTDEKYPCESTECIYKSVHFDKGLQHMDGARALIYARSRHADSDEGSDFARSRRQQIIIVALKNKLIKPLEWVTLARLKNLPIVIDGATDMDMNVSELLTVGKWFLKTSDDETKKISFEDHLYSPPNYLYGRYVLVPKESWESVHGYIKDQLQ